MFIDKLVQPAVLIMNKLPFKTKLVLSISVLFILLILPSRALFINHYTKHHMYNDQIIGLSYITHIQDLIQLIQKHRGLTNGYLAGNRSFKKAILENETKTSQYLSKLQNFDDKNLKLLRHHQAYIKALSYIELIQLHNITQHTMSGDIFTMHSSIISSLIKSIHTISSRTSFENNHNLKTNYIAKMLQEKLLLLEETTAQLRGLATGYFTQKQISKKEKEHLLTIYTMTKTYENNLIDNHILVDMDHYLSIQKKTMLASSKLDNILDIINKHILIETVPTYDGAMFFKQATQAVDIQNQLYTLLAQNYKLLVEKSHDALFRDLVLKLLGLLAIVLSAFYIFIAFYRSIASNLEQLQLASTLIAKGETDIHLDVATKDVLGNALLAFNHMSQTLDESISFLNGYKMAIDESSIVSKTNTKGIITYVNKQFCQITGYSQKELIGQAHNIIRHPDIEKEVFKDFWSTIKSKKIWKGVLPNKAKDGSTYIVDATIIPILDKDDNIIEYVGIRHDITELEKSKEEIKKQKIDLLTTLPNRNQLMDDLKVAKHPILLYLNIDDFAKLNDFYGTKIADQVLIHLSSLLKKLVSTTDCKLYKLHADGFLLVFEEGKLNRENHTTILQEIINYIESKTIDCDAQNCVSITLSGGVSFYDTTHEYQHLLEYANIARKVAKAEHKKFLTYQPDMHKDSDYENNIIWINKIKEAIEDNRFTTYFQPIIDNQNATITKYESLVRMIDVDGKVISPFFFLDIAKKAKLYTNITKIVLDNTFATLQENPHYDFSLNITVQDIHDEEIRAYIFKKLSDCTHANRIIFEITESEEITDYQFINTFIEKIRSFGSKIAIDDFGTGFANFEHIISLKADFIKIDGTLIKDIEHSHDAQIIIEAIIAFSKKLGSKTVVEYVHNEAVYEKVKSLGADYSQGYHLGEPSAHVSNIQDAISRQEV